MAMTENVLRDDPLTAPGSWVKARGRVKDGSLIARDIASIKDGTRERLKLRGKIEAAETPGGILKVMGIALQLTEATEIEDANGAGSAASELDASQGVTAYAKRTDDKGPWVATRVRLTDDDKERWEIEGVVKQRQQVDEGVQGLEIGPLQVLLDRSTLILDTQYRDSRVTPFDPSTWRRGRRQLIWNDPSGLPAESGFGTVTRDLILALDRQGVEIIVPKTKNRVSLGLERFFRPLDHWGRLGFYFHWSLHPSAMMSERVVNFSMWDSALIPKSQVDEINGAVTTQYVPCRMNLDSFREAGVRVPINLLHLGVDRNTFPYLHREPSEPFTFGTYGNLSPRKGIDVLVRAFRDEFQLREQVRLLMKSTSSMDTYTTEDPRITSVSSYMDQAALLALLRQMDVFVLPSRGEGFGLGGLEAMSTGLPLIATNWSGPVEYLDPADSFPLSYRLVQANGTRANKVRYFGLWAEPDYEHLRYLMRWAYNHRDEAAAMGRRAAERVHKDWTWERVARQLVEDLDALVSG